MTISERILLRPHRMLEIGKDFERSSSPIPLPQQEYLDHITQTHPGRF